MKTQNLSRILALIVVTSGALCTGRADDAGPVIDRKGSYTTSTGASGTGSSTTTLSRGGASTKGVWTNAAGGKGAWQSQDKWNKATKSGTFSGTATRPNGATSTWQGTSTKTAPGVFTSGGTVTLANGKQVTFKGTETRTAPGTWSGQQVITSPAGKTVDRNINTTVSPGSLNSTATSTLPNGQTASSTLTVQQTVTPAAPGK